MAARKFKSKVDSWIPVLILIVIVVQIVAITAAVREAGEPGMITSLILAMIGIAALMAWLLLGTHYTVDRGYIRIVSGPFRWKVPIAEITSVKATRNPLSSPALSLDRISIRYGKRRRIMISPADKAGFLEAIGYDLEN
jgi:hypothetical protein